MLTSHTLGIHEVWYDDEVVAQRREFAEFLSGQVPERIGETLVTPTIIVFGGDGTMLRTIQACYTVGHPFLGINLGNKGFLLNHFASIDSEVSWRSIEYPLLTADMMLANGQSFSSIAVNEICLRTTTGNVLHTQITQGGMTLTLAGDGFLIATPAGSTAYNASAGGPILPHDTHHTIFTPLFPIEPRAMKSVIYDRSRELIADARPKRAVRVALFADSSEIVSGIEGTFRLSVRESPYRITLLVAESQYSTWYDRIYIEQGFRRGL